MRLLDKSKSDTIRNHLVVNAADTWDEGLCSYPGRCVKLLPEGDARPEGAMGIRDGITGITEVSSGGSSCSLNSEGPDIRKLRSNSGTGIVVKKAENLPAGKAVLKE